MDPTMAFLFGLVAGMAGMGFVAVFWVKSQLEQVATRRTLKNTGVDLGKKTISAAVLAVIVASSFAPLGGHVAAAPLEPVTAYAPGAGARDLYVSSGFNDLFSNNYGDLYAPGVYEEIEGVAGQASLDIPTDVIFEQTNDWIATFAPIAAIGIGITIALAVLGYLGKMIASAFKA